MRSMFPGNEFLPAFESHPIATLVPVGLSAAALYAMWKLLQSLAAMKNRAMNFEFLPWEDAQKGAHDADMVVTDCTHPTAPTLSHHKGHNNPHGLKASAPCTHAESRVLLRPMHLHLCVLLC